MLGTEPDIVANYVEMGLVKVIFWPVLNHGNPSVYSTLTAECVGQQSVETFWEVHHVLFENQPDLWGANRDYYVQTAVAAGVDQTTFEACYDDPDNLAQVQKLTWELAQSQQEIIRLEAELERAREERDSEREKGQTRVEELLRKIGALERELELYEAGKL